MLDWQQVRYWNDVTWIWYSNIAMMVPLTFLFFYKLIKPIDYNTLLKPTFNVRSDFGDKFLTIICSYSVVYYIIDTIVRIMQGRYADGCDFSMFYHHVAASIFIPGICFGSHWPWFIVAPAAMHTYLLAFPEETWLNYIYLAALLSFQYGLYQKPFKYLKQYRRMRLFIILIEIACVFLWWFDCSNRLIEISA